MIEVIIWILVAIFLVVIDIITSSFIFMWFSLGALVAIILSLLNFTVLYQIIALIHEFCTGYAAQSLWISTLSAYVFFYAHKITSKI